MATFMPFVRESGFGPRSRRPRMGDGEPDPELTAGELLALLHDELDMPMPEEGMKGLFGSYPGDIPQEAPPTEVTGEGLPGVIKLLLALDRGAGSRAMERDERGDPGDLYDALFSQGDPKGTGLFGSNVVPGTLDRGPKRKPKPGIRERGR